MKLKIISDGNNSGTFILNEENNDPIGLIQKLAWESSADGFSLSKVTVELYNVPVEIVSIAEVELIDINNPDQILKTFEKEIKILSKPDGFSASKIEIFDNQTQEKVFGIQNIKWEATPDGRKAKIKKIKFGNQDW